MLVSNGKISQQLMKWGGRVSNNTPWIFPETFTENPVDIFDVMVTNTILEIIVKQTNQILLHGI